MKREASPATATHKTSLLMGGVTDGTSETTARRAAMPIVFGRPTTAGLALLLHTAAGDSQA